MSDFATIDWQGVATADLRILVGAIEVISGNFEVFDSDKTLEGLGLIPDGTKIDQYDTTRWRMRRALSLEGVAASGTLPEILPAQLIRDVRFPTCQPGKTISRDAFYWDGLFSQDPPVRDLLDAPTRDEKPDEIWVVRINPQEFSPSWIDDIPGGDPRSRERSGRQSVAQPGTRQHPDHQPLAEAVWGWSTRHQRRRKVVCVRTIKMTRDTVWSMRHTSKFDRDRGHLERSSPRRGPRGRRGGSPTGAPRVRHSSPTHTTRAIPSRCIGSADGTALPCRAVVNH
ncbi:MAG: hypothetical protein U1E43_07800 [Rhodospirillales bacterium]